MIYFDNSATTMLCEEALIALQQTAKEFGNPSSAHGLGAKSHTLVDHARKVILRSLGAPALTPMDLNCLIFTGGGTEANNLAVFGTYHAKKHAVPPRFITTDSEHPSVLEPMRRLESRGAEVIYLPTKGGTLDLAALEQVLTKETVFLSMMAVNNETGACYPIKEAFALAKQRCPGIVTHTDCVQAFGKIPLSVRNLGADLISVSAHKVHGPKGVGALYVSPEVRKAKKIVPYLLGGGQEYGLRSGTENVPGIVAFGAAVGAPSFGKTEACAQVRDYLLSHLPEGVIANLPPVQAPHILNLTLPDLKSETVVHFLSAKEIYVSAGSACASHGKGGSHVLKAFGLTDRQADTSIRISLANDATVADADGFLEALQQALATLVRIRR